MNYYTPKIEEFCIGFEYEQLIDGSYVKKIWEITDSGFINWDDVSDLINTCRVKNLDKSDLEELGFNLFKFTDTYDYYKKQVVRVDGNIITLVIRKKHKENKVYIEAIYDFTSLGILFNGVINNKSELKRMLNQIKL